MSEVVYFDKVPPHVIGLTRGGAKNFRFMVDTQLGTIQWLERFSEIASTSTQEEVYEDADDYDPDNEVEWRQEGGTWATADLFELLKDQSRALHFVPLSSKRVVDDYLPYTHQMEC
jgi:hypothetical protein